MPDNKVRENSSGKAGALALFFLLCFVCLSASCASKAVKHSTAEHASKDTVTGCCSLRAPLKLECKSSSKHQNRSSVFPEISYCDNLMTSDIEEQKR